MREWIQVYIYLLVVRYMMIEYLQLKKHFFSLEISVDAEYAYNLNLIINDLLF